MSTAKHERHRTRHTARLLVQKKMACAMRAGASGWTPKISRALHGRAPNCLTAHRTMRPGIIGNRFGVVQEFAARPFVCYDTQKVDLGSFRLDSERKPRLTSLAPVASGYMFDWDLLFTRYVGTAHMPPCKRGYAETVLTYSVAASL